MWENLKGNSTESGSIKQKQPFPNYLSASSDKPTTNVLNLEIKVILHKTQCNIFIFKYICATQGTVLRYK
jgi:hypothetical protein